MDYPIRLSGVALDFEYVVAAAGGVHAHQGSGHREGGQFAGRGYGDERQYDGQDESGRGDTDQGLPGGPARV